MTGTTLPRKKGKRALWLLVGLLVVLLAMTPLLVASWLDTAMFEPFVQAGAPQVQPATLPYDADAFAGHLRLLEDALEGSLQFMDVAGALQVELPTMRLWLYNLGFERVHWNEATHRWYMGYLNTSLQNMSGEDFGLDTAKWREWQQAKAAGAP